MLTNVEVYKEDEVSRLIKDLDDLTAIDGDDCPIL